MNINYADILKKMNADWAAEYFEKGIEYVIDKTTTVDGIQVHWHAMCADINMGCFLFSISRIDGKLPIENASLHISLINEESKRLGGGGGGTHYFDAEAGILYLMYTLNDMALLKPGKIKICADTMNSMPQTRISSALPIAAQSTPFYMPGGDHSMLSVSVDDVSFRDSFIQYSFTVKPKEKKGNACSVGIIFTESADSSPSLYIAELNKVNDAKYLHRCSGLSSERNESGYSCSCRFDTHDLTKEEIDKLYFVYNDREHITYKGDFGTAFMYEPSGGSIDYQKIDVDESIDIQDKRFSIKEIIIGSICTRIIIEGPLFDISRDISSIIKLTQNGEELRMLGASGRDDAVRVDFQTKDMDGELVLHINQHIIYVR